MSQSDDLPGRGIYQPLNPPEPVPAPPLPEERVEWSRDGQYGLDQHGTGYGDYGGDYSDGDDYDDYDDEYDDYDDAEDEYGPEDTDPGRSFRGIGAAGGYPAAPGQEDTDPGTRAASATFDGPTEYVAGGSGGRHARRGNQSPVSIPLPKMPRLDYMPRHAASPDVEPVSPTDLTEILARVREDPTEKPRPDRPESERVPPPAVPAALTEAPASAATPQDTQPGKRVRVVLSQRPGQSARPVRTVVDVREVTQVGEVLSSSLIRSQLALALRIAAIALLGLGALPAMFFYVPRLGTMEVFGVRLPWLLLGFAVYPFLLLLGWMYVRAADKLEQIFADHIQG